MWQSNDIPVIFYHASGVQTSLPGCHHALLLHICPVNTHKSSVVQASLHHDNSWTLLRACREVPWIVRRRKLEVSHISAYWCILLQPTTSLITLITTNIHVTWVAGWRGIWRNMLQGTVYKTTTIMLITVTCSTSNTGCHRRNEPNFGRVFLMLNYTDITQNTYSQSWMVSEIMASEVWNFDSCYTLTDYQILIETGRNMWFQ